MFMRILIAAILLVAWSQAVMAQTCNGLDATIIGTAGDDELRGTSGDDVILGLGGNDRILGGDGNDTICGGDGDDDLYGESGDDNLIGDAGNDVMTGDSTAENSGADSCDGVSGIDSADITCDTRSNVDADIYLLTLRAADGKMLDGALYVPVDDAASGGARNVALLVSHGAMGSYSFSVPKSWGLWGVAKGFTVLALDRRDAGMDGGGGTVIFEDATLLDLGAGIDLLSALGYPAVYLTGHSQGTQNAAIYPSFAMDPRIAAVGLYGTVDDGRDVAQNLLFNAQILGPDLGYPGLVTLNEQLVADGDGDILRDYDTIFGVPLTRTPNNWLSFWGPDSLSVVKREIEKLTIPALLMRANGDEFTPDKMSQNVLAAAQAAGVDATYTVLPFVDREGNDIPLTDNGGNAHGFVGVERAMVGESVSWLEGRVPGAADRSADFRVPQDDGSGVNFRPLAYAGLPQSVTTADGALGLDGSRSQDPDGEVVAWSWAQTGGNGVILDDPTSATPGFANPGAPTILSFDLTVTDNDGATDTVPVTLEVVAGPATSQPLPGGKSALTGLPVLLLAWLALSRRLRAGNQFGRDRKRL